MRRTRVLLLLVVLPILSFVSSWTLAATTKADFKFTDVRKQTVEFHQYEQTLKLTPEQTVIYREALQGLPAPCCPENTALTCCCPCNSAKAWWGLSKHLVANLGYDATATRAKVAEWFEFINPSGWSGNTCSTAGCGKPFHQSGCGGMNPGHVTF